MKRHAAGKRTSTRGGGRSSSRTPGFTGIAGALPLPLVLFDRVGRLVKANAEFLGMLGVQQGEVAGSRWLERIDAEDRRMAEETIAAATSARQPFRLRCRIRTREDRRCTCEFHFSPWRVGSRAKGYVATVADMTVRDASAHLARTVSSAFSGLSEHTSEMYVVIDGSGQIVHWNSALAQFSGQGKEEMVGRLFADAGGPGPLNDAISRAALTRKPQICRGVAWPNRSLPLQCRVFPVGDGYGVLMTPDREPTGSAAFEALRQSEERLRQSEERYRAFIENSSEGIWRFAMSAPVPIDAPPADQVRLIRTNAVLAESNGTLTRFCRSAPSELADSGMAAILQVDETALERYLMEFVNAGYRLGNVEVSPRDAGGDIRYLVCSLVGTVEHGALVQMWGTMRDVTEHREAERRLRLLARTLTSVRDAVSITDMENRILFVNDAFLETYGFPEEQLIGQDIALVRAEGATSALDEEIQATTLAGGWYGEVLNRRLDGTVFPVELWTSVVHNDEGDPVAMVGVAREITGRKRTEENLRTSLREKEVLLKEIHHRVKNNLQVISSLLSLQTGYLEDPKMVRIIQESQNRVRSMALVHEKLYQSHNVAEIDFGDYIRDLIGQLVKSYGTQDSRVQTVVRADPVALGVDRAIPCGIIANELVTNAMKYAFPEERTGTIDVELKSLSPGVIRLKVKDDGVGLPPGFDLREAKSLGLTLVQMLAEQVQGDLSIVPGTPGVEFVIVFRK